MKVHFVQHSFVQISTLLGDQYVILCNTLDSTLFLPNFVMVSLIYPRGISNRRPKNKGVSTGTLKLLFSNSYTIKMASPIYNVIFHPFSSIYSRNVACIFFSVNKPLCCQFKSDNNRQRWDIFQTYKSHANWPKPTTSSNFSNVCSPLSFKMYWKQSGKRLWHYSDVWLGNSGLRCLPVSWSEQLIIRRAKWCHGRYSSSTPSSIVTTDRIVLKWKI